MGPLIYISTTSKKTIQLLLRMFNTQYSSNYAQIMAAATVALIPVLILFDMIYSNILQQGRQVKADFPEFIRAELNERLSPAL